MSRLTSLALAWRSVTTRLFLRRLLGRPLSATTATSAAPTRLASSEADGSVNAPSRESTCCGGVFAPCAATAAAAVATPSAAPSATVPGRISS
uniref:Uncharacterized protein n=1 Tax=Arundo donax TaxID=35708 RepID=A0A0A8YVZ8_ARUDO